jgi:hypothetical protein
VASLVAPPPRPPRRLPRRWGLALFLVLGFLLYRWLDDRGGPGARPAPPAGPAVEVGAGVAPAAPAHGGTTQPARDLAADERQGGHTLARHVGRDDGELERRLARERSLGAASTFDDRATAERVVGATLLREERRIAAWLSRRGGDLALDYRGSPAAPIGRVLVRGDRAPRRAADARVVLRRAADSFYVLTAYPLE